MSFPDQANDEPTDLASEVRALRLSVADQRRQIAELRESEAKFRAIFECMSAGITVTDASGRFIACNPAFAALVGRTPNDVIGRTPADFTHPDDWAEQQPTFDAARDGRQDQFHRVKRYVRPDGGVVWAELSFAAVRGADGGYRYGLGVTVDVTDRKRAEADLRASEERFDLAVRGSHDGIWDWDLRTGRVYFSPRWKEMLGYAEHEVAAHVDEWRRLTHPDDLVLAEAALRAYFARTAPRYGLEVRMRHKDGSFRWISTRGMAQWAADGTPVRMAGSHTDVTETKWAEEELRRNEQRLLGYQAELEAANAKLLTLATTDALTGLANRGAFNRRLDEAFDLSARTGRPLTLLLLDVDHFKQFNDAFGHPAGDDVLRRVARALEHAVRTSDLVARYGGEEFAVLLPDTNDSGAVVLADRLRRAVAGASWDKRPVTVSVGAATRSDGTADAKALVKEADEALYQSKREGRNRVSYGSGVVGMATTRR